MHVHRITCTDFRCLRSIDFEPARGINVLRGLNAQGKTSLLEALLYAATSKSHRTSVEAELVAYDRDGFHICVEAECHDQPVKLEANWWKGAKRFKVNGVSLTRVSDILGKLYVILFTPEDIALVKGGAAVRRTFLDMELSQIDPAYLAALQRYRQVLRQRNGILKRDRADEDLLSAWDDQLVTHASVLMRKRQSFISRLAILASEAYTSIAGGEELELKYGRDIEEDADIGEVLLQSRDVDIRRRSTTRGPHRDDIEVSIDGHSARRLASQGQQKAAALAIKLAEMKLVEERRGEYPILMLDEVLSELDERRARALLAAIPDAVQCLLTTTQLGNDEELLGRRVKSILVDKGQLR